MVNNDDIATCTWCGRKDTRFDAKLLAKAGEAPFDPFEAATETDLNIAEIGQKIVQLRWVVAVGSSIPTNTHRLAISGFYRSIGDNQGIAGELGRLLDRAVEALNNAPARIEGAKMAIKSFVTFFENEVSDLTTAVEYYEKLDASRNLVAKAEMALASETCPLCNGQLKQAGVGFATSYCTGYPPEGGHCHHPDPERIERVRQDRVIRVAMNERGEFLAAFIQTVNDPRSHLYRGPRYGDVIFQEWQHLKDHTEAWDGITPFETFRIKSFVVKKSKRTKG